MPAVVGLTDATRLITSGTPLVIDGDSGAVLVGASSDDAGEPEMPTRDGAPGVPERPVRGVQTAPPHGRAVTRDHVEIVLEANLERIDDAPRATAAGADGVGLFRSEFLLAGRRIEDVSEDEQVEAYRRLLESVAPRRVTIRTFDLDESHVSLSGRTAYGSGRGLRGLRLGLAQPDVLRRQLRALARSSPAGQLRVMFPFVTTVDEIRAAVEGAPGEHHVADLHVWRVGKRVYACALTVVTHDPSLTADQVREWLAVHEEIAHSTIEVHRCQALA